MLHKTHSWYCFIKLVNVVTEDPDVKIELDEHAENIVMILYFTDSVDM